MTPQHAAEAVGRAMFAADAASQALGMQLLEIAPGRAVMTLTVRADMLNGFAICHGGLIATLADSAFAFACNSHNHLTVASGFGIDILQSARLGDELTATAETVSQGRTAGLYDVTVRNQGGEVVALFRGRSHQLKGRTVLKEEPA